MACQRQARVASHIYSGGCCERNDRPLQPKRFHFPDVHYEHLQNTFYILIKNEDIGGAWKFWLEGKTYRKFWLGKPFKTERF